MLVLVLAAMIISICCTTTGCNKPKNISGLTLAVEYNTHAACAYVAQNKGWLAEKGHDKGSFDVYVTGVALAGALAKGDVDAAYICLIPAITAYANADVPIKIVCGTHKYGYALVIDPSKVSTIKDLEKEGIKIGCVREGGTTDILLHKIIEHYGLDKEKVLGNVLRMNPAKQIMAIKTKKLDAVVVPEHFATIAEQKLGLKMLLKSQDIWPQMQGSVLVVTDRLLSENPGTVRDLFKITSMATDYINQYPSEAAEIVTNKLNTFQDTVHLREMADGNTDFDVTSDILSRSMVNLSYTTQIDQIGVQEVIDFMFKVGYIKERFPASDILLEQSYFKGEKNE